MKFNTKFSRLAVAEAVALLALAACGGGGGAGTTESAASVASSRGNEEALAVGSGTWVALVNEGANFNVNGTQTVRLGAGTRWAEKVVTDSGSCTNSFFGSDPAPGTYKACQLFVPDAGAAPAPAPAADSWTQVANEWADFSTNGAQTARFGFGSSWTQRTVNGAGYCTTSFFGSDPAPGVVKVCQVGGTATTPQPAPTPAPAPAPTPAPAPATTSGGVLQTGTGLGTLPANPRLNAGVSGEQVQSTSEQAYASNDGTGDFRTRCLPSHFAFDDPIVFPGQVGRSHLHVFFGNTNSNANSTSDSLRNSGNSTCRGGTVNRSSYWVPALIDTTTNLPVVPDESDFYYKSGYKGVRPDQIKPMPAGLRMVAGDPNNRVDLGYNSPYTWVCHNAGTNRGQTIPTCGAGDQLELSIAFPQCWDGVNLDSPDHKSHMAYGNGSGCPSSHPVALPEVSFHVLYPISGNQGAWRLSSDAATGGAGYSAHADWFNGWKQDVSDAWSTRCVGEGKDCHSHLLGDGRAIY